VIREDTGFTDADHALHFLTVFAGSVFDTTFVD